MSKKFVILYPYVNVDWEIDKFSTVAEVRSVAIATLAREVETQQIKNEQLEVSFRVLAQGRVGTPPVEGV